MSKYESFAALHVPGDPVIIYNCWDPGSAVAIAKAGAKAIATGSHGVAESLGFKDGEDLPMALALDNARRIMGVVDLPVSIDFESGYSHEAAAVTANLAKLAATGAVGCNFEDSVIGGEGVYPIDEGSARVAAARAGAGDAFYINARVDLWLRTPVEQRNAAIIDRVVERAQAYVAAGASGIFVPGLRDVDLVAAVVKRSGARINIIPGPDQPTKAFADVGVARISYGAGPWNAAMTWLQEQARPAINWRG